MLPQSLKSLVTGWMTGFDSWEEWYFAVCCCVKIVSENHAGLGLRYQMKFRVLWDVAPCSHIEVDQRFRGAYCLHHQGTLMEAGCTSEMSVHFNVTTRRYIPQNSKLPTHCHENLKSHLGTRWFSLVVKWSAYKADSLPQCNA
jgi:hypothetical protein